MDKYVVSRELAEKLKDAKYPQETEFSFGKYQAVLNEGWKVWPTKTLKVEKHYDCIATPLSDELLEQLRPVLSLGLTLQARDNGFEVMIHRADNDCPTTEPLKPADALAELWLWCKELGYVS